MLVIQDTHASKEIFGHGKLNSSSKNYYHNIF
jgi:hypothetical protein